MYNCFAGLILLFEMVYSEANSCSGVSVSNRRLSDYEYLVMYRMSFEKCKEECGLRTNCLSINYSEHKKSCEFNYAKEGLNNSLSVNYEYVYCENEGDLITSGNCAGFVCPVNHKCVTFNNVGARCIRTECTDPPTISNAIVNPGYRGVGRSSSYQCESGYTLQGNPNTTCKASGNWTEISFSCRVLECSGEPEGVENATLNLGSNVVGSIRKYTCKAPLGESGPTTVICQTNETWSLPTFICGEVCGSTPFVANAKINEGFNTTGSIRNYTCNPGFSADDIRTECQSNYTWTTPSSVCEPDCTISEISLPDYASSDSGGMNTTKFGDTYTIPCHNGYTANGTTTIWCLSGGVWETPSFICQRECPTMYGFVMSTSPFLCYRIGGLGLTRSIADVYCKSLGGILLEVTNVEIFNFIIGVIDYKSWIGGYTAHDRNFTWEDGRVVTYENWAPGQGSGVNQNCLLIDNDGIYDRDCTSLEDFVCQVYI